MMDFDESRLERDNIGILQGYGYQPGAMWTEFDSPKAVGTPSQMIAHFGLARHPFLLT